jgi:hypothetical protein
MYIGNVVRLSRTTERHESYRLPQWPLNNQNLIYSTSSHPEQRLPEMGCAGNPATVFAKAVNQSLDRRSSDRSSPCDREDPRRHPRWRTHLTKHRELQRSADCPRSGRYGNRRDQNHVAFAMASADKWVGASLFPTKIDDCSEGPQSRTNRPSGTGDPARI